VFIIGSLPAGAIRCVYGRCAAADYGAERPNRPGWVATIYDSMSLTRQDGEGLAGDDDRSDALLRAALELAAEHDVDQLLDLMVRCAATVAGARYAALGVYDRSGHIERFVHFGLDAETAARIGDLPEGRGLLGDVIVADGPIRLADLAAEPRSCGFPPHHPAMRTFLGVPVRAGNRRFGNLYLTEKHGGAEFDEEDERRVVTLAAFAACAIEGALLVAVERDRAEAVSELAAARERATAQREILARVIDAQEAERARVARDLHDQIGQALTSVLLGLRLVDGSVYDGPHAEEVRERTDEVRELVAQALDEVRELAFELRPTVLDDVGLVAAVRRLADNLTRRYGVRVELVLNGLDDDRRLPPDVETVVYRVVQEALTNVARHAQASISTVTIIVDGQGMRASIVDDGIGFELGDAALRSLGLAGMTERASLAGGRVEIASVPTQGTAVTLEVPV
jgi:signal transduction histidine kinase